MEAPKHRVPKSKCIRCGKGLDACVSSLDGDVNAPSPGDLSFCCYCGHLCIYADDLTLREMTREEISEVMRDAELANHIIAMRQVVHVADTNG